LLDDTITDEPLNRNQIFDADYKNGNLLLAYWGKRTFEYVDKNGTQRTLVQQIAPLTPHWVAYLKNEKLLFSSKLVFDGSTPKPFLVLVKETDKTSVLWGSN